MDENKYQRGKIYKIVCNKSNLIYIGSTIEKYLSNRLKRHRLDYRKFLNGKHRFITSFKILENDDYYIELIELFPCNSKDELLVRERYYFDNIECINKQKPSWTLEEKKECQKRSVIKCKDTRIKSYEDNKDAINERRRIKYEQDKEKREKYKEEHKEELKQKRREYYERTKK
jgi:hypothetical protein